jgi:hypothetical protein
MYEQILGALAQGASNSGGSAGGNAQGAKNESLSIPTTVNVAPVGLNLGSILQPFMGTSQNNGGYGYDAVSRLGYGYQNVAGVTPLTASLLESDPTTGKSSGTTKILIYAGVGIGVVILIAAMKRR